MTKVRRRKGLSGTVLIMILTVMVILIIMLMATLSVVTTANQRIYTKFEENQAYYSARSALDVFTNQIMRDSGYYAYDTGSARKYEYPGDGTEYPMKQGLAMEFEFYKIRVPKDSPNNAGLASNFTEADGVYGSGSAEALNYSADDDENMTSIVYNVKFPKLTDSSSSDQSYGAMVDRKGTDEQDATITVEVESRIYSFGGTSASAFSGMTEAELKQVSESGLTKNGINYTADMLKDAIKEGSRSKDKIRLKITSTANFMDTEGSAVVYLDTTEKPKVNSSQAITSMGGVSGGSGTFALGGTSGLSDVSTQDGSTLVGDLYVGGNFTFINSSNKIYYFGDTVYTIRGNWAITSDQGPNDKHIFMEPGSVIYVTGTMSMGSSNGPFASSAAPANIISNNLTFAGNGQQGTYYGNFYSNNLIVAAGSTPTINGMVYTNFVDISATVDPVYDYDLSSMEVTLNFNWFNNKIKFCNDTDLSGNPLGGIIMPLPGDPTMTGVFRVTGTVGSYALIVPDEDPIYGGQELFVTGGGSFSFCPQLKIDYNDPNDYAPNGDGKKKITLPAYLAGTSKDYVEIPTAKKLYSEILHETAFVNNAVDDGTNDDIDTSATEYPVFSGTISPEFASTIEIDEGWRTVTASKPDCIDGIAKGLITDDNCTSYGYANQWDGDWINDKRIAELAYQALAASDPAYQQALADYFAVYITGAEKAQSSVPSLNEFPSTKVTVNPYSSGVDAELDTIAGTIAGGIKGIINSNGYIEPNSTEYGKVTSNNGKHSFGEGAVIIDARSSDITLQLGNGSGSDTFMGAFIVIGDNTVKLYLPDGKTDYNLGTTASGQGFFMCTYDIYKAYKVDDELRLGDATTYPDTAPATPTPNIFVYAGDNVKRVTLPTEDSFLSAHVYIPFADYTYGRNDGVKFARIKYRNHLIDYADSAGFNIIGSLICNSYTTGNKSGVAYIAQDNDNYKPGDPIFNWSVNRYARY